MLRLAELWSSHLGTIERAEWGGLHGFPRAHARESLDVAPEWLGRPAR